MGSRRLKFPLKAFLELTFTTRSFKRKPKKDANEAKTKTKKNEEVSSRFMNLPDKPFTMNYTERFINVQQTKESANFMSKKFQDGWHFWNWWVLQTGNGKTDAISGWNYTNESGETVRLWKNSFKKGQKNQGGS